MRRRECAASRLNRLMPGEKGAQGQCINGQIGLSCHLKIIVSPRTNFFTKVSPLV